MRGYPRARSSPMHLPSTSSNRNRSPSFACPCGPLVEARASMGSSLSIRDGTVFVSHLPNALWVNDRYRSGPATATRTVWDVC